MKRLDLVIAGTSLSIQMDGAIAALRDPLRKIFRGFIVPKGGTDVRITVSYDHSASYKRFDGDPILLPPGEGNSPLRCRMAELYPIEGSLMIGFLNGVLAYKVGAHEARLLLFRSEGENILVGSLIKLLFLFIAIVMVERDRLMLHGAGLTMGAEGFLFLGMSGAGKSTIAGYADREGVLSDDAPVIARNGASFTIHASPFSQVDLFNRKAADHHDKEAPLARLVFLRQANRLALEPRDNVSVLAELLRDHIHGFDIMGRELRVRAFEFCCDLCESVRGFNLFFQNNDRFLSFFDPRLSRR